MKQSKKIKVGFFCGCPGCRTNGKDLKIAQRLMTEEEIRLENNKLIKDSEPYIYIKRL